MTATTIDAGTRLKWWLFRLLETLSELRSHGAGADGNAQAPGPPLEPGRSAPLWVFVSTIGELNAIEPFLRRLLAEMGAPPLILLTDHPHYRDSFTAKYPGARVCALDHRSATVAALAAALPPRLLVLAEIPCLLSDAPCRFPFAALYELKRRGIPVCVVNGWLYRGSPSCTMDAIERTLFGRAYPRLFDLITVQDEATREVLTAAGADPRRVFVTGNIKFDAVERTQWDAAASRSPALLSSIASGGRPALVAGCVTNIPEQALVLDAFAAVLQRHPDALLVLAPRHPEVKERMDRLRALLAERNLSHAFRSQSGDAAPPATTSCLVLDTMGELKDFYAAGSIAYVGLNHNVLEPLSFGKPVIVTPGWEPVYPSFPVYKHLLAEGAIVQVEKEGLADAWLDLLRDPRAYSSRREQTGAVLESLKGATARNLELFAQFGLSQSAVEPPMAADGRR